MTEHRFTGAVDLTWMVDEGFALPAWLDVRGIADEAWHAAFKIIADRLTEATGAPTWGDMAPSEQAMLQRTFEMFVFLMARNNEWVQHHAIEDEAALRKALVAEAEALGIGIDHDRFDPFFLSEMIVEIKALPEDERAAAVRAVNDGATVEDRWSYPF